MKYGKTILAAITLLTASATTAFADCGNWRAGTSYTGPFSGGRIGGLVNTIVITQIGSNGNACNALVTFVAGPRQEFAGARRENVPARVNGGQMTLASPISGKPMVYTARDQGSPYVNIQANFDPQGTNDIGQMTLQ